MKEQFCCGASVRPTQTRPGCPARIPFTYMSAAPSPMLELPTFLNEPVMTPGDQLYASSMSCSLICWPPVAPMFPRRPIANTYIKTAALIAVAIKRRAAMTSEAARLSKRLMRRPDLQNATQVGA